MSALAKSSPAPAVAVAAALALRSAHSGIKASYDRHIEIDAQLIHSHYAPEVAELERQRDNANSIKTAEKKILIAEIERRASIQGELAAVRAEVRELRRGLKLITTNGGTPEDRREFCKTHGIGVADSNGIAQAALRVSSGSDVGAHGDLSKLRGLLQEAEAALTNSKTLLVGKYEFEAGAEINDLLKRIAVETAS